MKQRKNVRRTIGSVCMIAGGLMISLAVMMIEKEPTELPDVFTQVEVYEPNRKQPGKGIEFIGSGLEEGVKIIEEMSFDYRQGKLDGIQSTQNCWDMSMNEPDRAKRDSLNADFRKWIISTKCGVWEYE